MDDDTTTGIDNSNKSIINKVWWQRLTSKEREDNELNDDIITVIIKRLFKISYRKTTIRNEIKYGLYHYISTCFIIAVNSSLLSEAGYSSLQVSLNTAIVAGVTCVVSGIISNLPFVLSPATSTSLYYAFFIKNNKLSASEGNFAVFLLGLLMFFCGIRPIALFITNSIPFVMKVGICLGVGLLVALNSLAVIGLVKKGTTTILDIGDFTPEIYIAMAAFVLIGLSLHYRVRYSFLLGMLSGTALYYLLALINNHGEVGKVSWDLFIVSKEDFHFSADAFTSSVASNLKVYRLVFDLYIIGVILLNGLANGLADMSGLKREDGTIPRGKWLYAACGMGTILSSLLGAGPIMILPESAPGIKSGARTGLSSLVCGILFLSSALFSPVFALVPRCGTSPVLLMMGMMLFENAGKVNWAVVQEALPVFIMSVFIPFTYSIFNGVLFGFAIYIILFVFTDSRFRKISRRICRYMRRGCCRCCGCCSSTGCCCGSQPVNSDAEDLLLERVGSEDNVLPGSFRKRNQTNKILTFELNDVNAQPYVYMENEYNYNNPSLHPTNDRSSEADSTGDYKVTTTYSPAPSRNSISSDISDNSVGSIWNWFFGNTNSQRRINAGAGALMTNSNADIPDWVLD